MRLKAWLGRSILSVCLGMVIAASTANPALARDGGESSVGSGIGPSITAMMQYSKSPEVQKALEELKRQGYEASGPSVMLVASNVSEPDGNEQSGAGLRRTVFLITTTLNKGSEPSRTVSAIVTVSGDCRTATLVFVPEAKFRRALQDMVAP